MQAPSQISRAGRDVRDYLIKRPHFTEETKPEKGSVMSRAAGFQAGSPELSPAKAAPPLTHP